MHEVEDSSSSEDIVVLKVRAKSKIRQRENVERGRFQGIASKDFSPNFGSSLTSSLPLLLLLCLMLQHRAYYRLSIINI